MTSSILLSLSRLNHCLPRGQAHPEVVEGTTEFHHQIADALLPQADAVFDDATTLDTAVDRLDPQPTLVQRLVRPLLLQRERLAAWLLGWHEDLHPRERERQESQILSQPAPCGQGIRGRVGNALVMDTAVAYLGAADNVSRLLAIPLRRANEPVIRTRNRFAIPRPSHLASI